MGKIVTGLLDVSDITNDAFVTKDFVLDYYPNMMPEKIAPGFYWRGSNTYGEAGDNQRSDWFVNQFSRLDTLRSWKAAECRSSNSIGLKKDGTIWAIGGANQYGLGLGDSAWRSSPVQIGSGTNWSQITDGCGGAYITCAINTSGQLFCVGDAWGSFGLNPNTTKNTLTQVGSNTNWKFVSVGASHLSLVTTDGMLWAWGKNGYGQLGVSDLTHRSSPVRIGTSSDWKMVSSTGDHTLALKFDGSLWTWGNNSNGQLGLDDRTHRSSPVQVGSSTDWNKICGNSTSSHAIKTNGTLWSWGSNTNWELGLGDTTHRSSPIQVGSLAMWGQISGYGGSVGALRNDGTIWMWGYGGYTPWGSHTNGSVPTQVGTLTTWTYVSVGQTSFAIKDEENW